MSPDTPPPRRVVVSGVGLEVIHRPARPGALTLVFLHEGLGSARMWRGFPARLAATLGEGAGLLVYSRQGYGGSDPIPLPRPLDYMQREGEAVLPALLKALGVGPSVLYGHSDGGSIALVAGSGPAPGVQGLILEAPHVVCEDISVRAIAQARRAYEEGDLRARLLRHHGENVDGAFWGWCRAWLDPGFRRWSLAPYLPRITAPTLVIQGRDDPYGTLAQVDAIVRGVSGDCTAAVLRGCGHAPHRERADAVMEQAGALLEWVERG